MACLYILVYSYTLVYGSSHSSQHYIHKPQDRDLCIYSCCMQKPTDNLNQLSIQVCNLGKGHRNNQVNMSMIPRFVGLYIQHLHHREMVHMDLDIRPLEELKCFSNRINSLTDKQVSHRRSTSLFRSVSWSLLGLATFSDLHYPASASLFQAAPSISGRLVGQPKLYCKCYVISACSVIKQKALFHINSYSSSYIPSGSEHHFLMFIVSVPTTWIEAYFQSIYIGSVFM